MEVPIFYYNVDGSQIIRHEILQNIFHKVGTRPFVVLSLNGMKKTGKSFILTQILRQLSPMAAVADMQWKSDPELTSSVGIEIWSEPITITAQNGREVCVILLKVQTRFEPPATIQQNATVSAISLILSSFFILNLRKSISKENLAFLQYFLNLAKSFDIGGESKFQRIFFLVRDMELRVKDFSHGYHTPTFKPPATAHSQTNLFTQIFSLDPTRQPLEVQHTFRQVLSAFQEFGLFALPEPRTPLRSQLSANPNLEFDLEFQNYVQAVTDLLLNPDSSLLLQETKKVGGVEITGYEFMEVIDQLERMFQRSPHSSAQIENGPEQSRAEMINTISTSNLVSLYVSTINDFIAENTRKTGKPGMYQKTLAEKMNSFLKICVETFSRRLSLGDEVLKEKFKETLSEEILEKMKLFETLNDSRLKYSRQAQGLNSEVSTILERLESLRVQEKEDGEEVWRDSGEPEMDRQIGKRLRAARALHLRKQMEECESRLGQIQEQVATVQIENQKNLDQIVKVIQIISKIY